MEYCKKKENKKSKYIPIILLNAFYDKYEILNANQNYLKCYIIKPSNDKEFLNIIHVIFKFWTKSAKLHLQDTEIGVDNKDYDITIRE